MLTPRGLTLLALALLAWTLGRFLGVDELYVVSGASVAMVGLAVLATRVASPRVAARRTAGVVHTAVGEPATVGVELRNDGRFPAAMLLVEDRRPAGVVAGHGGGAARFVIPGLRPRQTVELRAEVTGRRRGRYRVGPLRIRLRDPLGLAERTRRYRSHDDLVVFPAIEPLHRPGRRKLRQGAGSRTTRRAFHQGDEFYTMRAYVVGDDLRHVHWPSTAHRGTLMVRQHELPADTAAVVHVDARTAVHRGSGDTGTFERAVSTAASAVRHLSERGYDVRLVADAAEPVRAAGDAALVRLADLTSQRDPDPGGTLSAVTAAGDGVLVSVTRPTRDGPLVDHVDTRALLRAGAGYRTRVALVVALDDGPRCAELARLLQLAGWHAAVVAVDEPLADAWERAVVGAAVGNTTDRQGATA